MTRKRGSTDLSGVLAIDKPVGISSHAVVDLVRKATGEGRVGHAGTLDPLASGLLLVCVGAACRLCGYLSAEPKTYMARVVFGSATDTDDALGEVTKRAPLPAILQKAERAQDFLLGLIGEHQQLPPTYSAVKKQGQRSYKAARQGRNLELESRRIELLDLSLLALGSGYWDIRVRASKGTYIRSLARDIGQMLDSAAHLGALRRLQSGSLHVNDAVAPPDSPPFDTKSHFIHLPDALNMPFWQTDEHGAAKVRDGRRIILNDDTAIISRQNSPIISQECANIARQLGITHGGRLLAIYSAKDSDLAGVTEPVQTGRSYQLRAKTVIPGGVELGQRSASTPWVCAIGVFDGVHAGHQDLLRSLADTAAESAAKPVVLTFDRDPDALLHADKLQKLLPDAQRLELLQRLAGEVVALTFDEHTANLDWRRFLETSLFTRPGLSGVLVGENFRFGARAAAGTEEMRQYLNERGVWLRAQKLLEKDGQTVSSSRIRRLLAAGELSLANVLLTRPYTVCGEVVFGHGRGAKLGFPTANVIASSCSAPLQPAVYAAYCQLDGQRYRAAVSIGEPPSFANSEISLSASAQLPILLEVHLLDFAGDIYGRRLSVQFIAKLRDMQRFNDITDLQAAVRANIQWVRDNLAP